MDERHQARGYQLEMLNESMGANVIVAMDTGSGKTHVAILRIMAELDRCPAHKLIWFLAPTVDLCTQQCNVIAKQIPAVRTRLLLGSDNVDRWSNQRTWDAVLENVQVVISTHAVLADALGHGFVRMSRLALLVFDEAHHCSRKHPANRIMRDFYHPAKQQNGTEAVPHILGLTASPIVRSSPKELDLIEANLASITKTPRIERLEMMQYVHRPRLCKLSYRAIAAEDVASGGASLGGLRSICRSMDNCNDPYVLKLAADPNSKRKMTEVVESGKTFCREQMLRFCRTAEHVYEELGRWAVEYYIRESVMRLRNAVDRRKDVFLELDDSEKIYIMKLLSKIPGLEGPDPICEGSFISPKVETLVHFLIEEDRIDFSGLVFVRQRAAVSVLSKLLSTLSATKDRFQCAPYVGWSNSASRKQSINELLDLESQRETLVDFRAGRKNLIIATSVLEEGIDITACRLVVNFDIPPNLKSFVQRRGRARQKESTFAIMVAEDVPSTSISDWQRLEEDMIRTYQDNSRQLKEASAVEDEEEDVPYQLRVPSTQALITADSAVAHLHHFCALLPPQPFADLRPVYTFTEKSRPGLTQCSILLPSSVHASVRNATGCKAWRTERAAMKDAAFQSYVALYRAGLVNDNLLPLKDESEEAKLETNAIPARIDAADQMSLWAEMAVAWQYQSVHRYTVAIEENDGTGDNSTLLWLTVPVSIPRIPPFELYWNKETTFRCKLALVHRELSYNDLDVLKAATRTILQSTRASPSLAKRDDFVVLFTPHIARDTLETWLADIGGIIPALEVYSCGRDPQSLGFVRSSMNYMSPCIFKRWYVALVDGGDEELHVDMVPATKRRNFLQSPASISDSGTDREEDDSADKGPLKYKGFPASTCSFDLTPLEYVRSAMFLPAILQKVEVYAVADRLCNTILKTVQLNRIDGVIAAISTPSAQWSVNYQRHEYLGDSVLKFITSCQLFIDHPSWHEGYLTKHRTSMISNSRLARAALSAGLDAFIMTKAFNVKKWTCPMISELQGSVPEKREISSKVLADVVEALTGAAFEDGGFQPAQTCLNVFLPEISLETYSFQSIREDHARHASTVGSILLDKAELLIGHSFHHKSLLAEALTHPSCDANVISESYQRLEFLGDSVLDMIVVRLLFAHRPALSQGSMTLTKAALVSADFLAFICMTACLEQPRTQSIVQTAHGTFEPVEGLERTELWKFMRHHSASISAAQAACVARYTALRSAIEDALARADRHPWTLFAQLNADKFFSDLVESILGAIFVDADGGLDACVCFLEKMGILPQLRRVMAKGVDVEHPKTKLGRLADKGSVEYVIEPDAGGFGCTVKVDGREIVQVSGCLGRDEAEVRAADAAVGRMLENERLAYVL